MDTDTSSTSNKKGLSTQTHCVRINRRSPSTSYTVDGPMLRIEVENAPPRNVPLKEVKSFWIRNAPSAGDQKRCRCDLYMHDGEHILIVSTDCKLKGKSDNRAESYNALLESLVSGIREVNPSCDIRTAMQPWAMYAYAIFLLVVIGVPTFAIATNKDLSWSTVSFSSFILPLGMILLVFGTLGFAWPKSLKGTKIPESFLAK